MRIYRPFMMKSLDEEKRILTGFATTPSTDRMDDVIEPRGAEYKLPLPFLWQHDSRAPVGWVNAAIVDDSGIEVTVQMAKTDEPGRLKDRLDEAWQSLKLKLVRGFSIGLNPLETSRIEGTWGLHILKWEWLELSAVTIPANQDASIQTIKSISERELAALRGSSRVVSLGRSPAGVAAPIVPKKLPTGAKNMNIAEQIKEFTEARKQKTARMAEILEKSSKDGQTLGETEAQEYDTLVAESETILKHLDRLELLQKQQMTTARPIVTAPVDDNAGVIDPPAQHAAPKQSGTGAVARAVKLGEGLAMAQCVKLLGLTGGNRSDAFEMAKSLGHLLDPRVALVLKAAVAAATTSNETWAAPLVGEETSAYADFVNFLRPATIVGKFGLGNIPSLRRVPFRIPLIAQDSGGSGYWVGEGAPKPLTKFDFSRKTLSPLKVANIAVITMETLRDSTPSADVLIRDSLVEALQERIDLTFIDPSVVAVNGVSPASILNGAPNEASSGPTADDVRADIATLWDLFLVANQNPNPANAVYIMAATTALRLSLMQNPLGQSEFPGINMNGGTFLGLPVIISQYVPVDSGGAIVALVNAQEIYFGDNGGFTVDMSREASLQMDNAPTNNSATPTATTLVSMFQTNSVAFRAERSLDWLKRRALAAAYLTDVNWGAGS